MTPSPRPQQLRPQSGSCSLSELTTPSQLSLLPPHPWPPTTVDPAWVGILELPVFNHPGYLLKMQALGPLQVYLAKMQSYRVQRKRPIVRW